jgi:hypothetical protein
LTPEPQKQLEISNQLYFRNALTESFPMMYRTRSESSQTLRSWCFAHLGLGFDAHNKTTEVSKVQKQKVHDHTFPTKKEF